MYTYVDIPVIFMSCCACSLLRDYKDAKIVKKFEFPEYEHADFVWSETAPAKLYDPLVEIFKQY